MDPKKVHQIDQETGPLGELAAKLAAYHRALVEEGFAREEALRIVMAYQEAIVRSLRSRD